MTDIDRPRKGYNPDRVYRYRIITMNSGDPSPFSGFYSVDAYYIKGRELEQLHESLPIKVQTSLKDGQIKNADFQLLMSLCWFCWGGMDIKKYGLLDWFKKPIILHDYYLNFTIRILSALRNFDRSKGNWASQVRFARQGAVTMTMRDHMKLRRNARLFEQLDESQNQECTWEDIENELFTAKQAEVI